jgi:hypothetical protein
MMTTTLNLVRRGLESLDNNMIQCWEAIELSHNTGLKGDNSHT